MVAPVPLRGKPRPPGPCPFPPRRVPIRAVTWSQYEPTRRETMKRAMILTVLVALGAVSGLRADDAKPEGDLKKMQGTWVRDGGDGPEVKWVIEGDTLKAKVGDQDYTCKLTLDPKATPNR